MSNFRGLEFEKPVLHKRARRTLREPESRGDLGSLAYHQTRIDHNLSCESPPGPGTGAWKIFCCLKHTAI